MEAVNIWYQDRRGEDEKKDMARQEVRAPQRQLDDLHNELTRGLRHGVRAEAAAVPLARPPRAVRLLVLELTGEEYRDEDLLDRTLNGDNGNDAEHGMRRIPELEEPLRFRLVVTNCFIR